MQKTRGFLWLFMWDARGVKKWILQFDFRLDPFKIAT